MTDGGWSVILRSSRTRLLFLGHVETNLTSRGTTFDLMQALNLRALCDLTVFAIPMFAILVVYHDIMHHNMAFMFHYTNHFKDQGNLSLFCFADHGFRAHKYHLNQLCADTCPT